MTKTNFLTGSAGLVLIASLLAGCGPSTSSSTTVAESTPAAPAPAATPEANVPDDYDYYPGYEVYYSRNRHEYVYRDGSNWVRRPQPRGISIDLLRAAPSVRMDFHDAPARHHETIVRTYPHDWRDTNHDGKVDGRDRRDDKKDDHRK